MTTSSDIPAGLTIPEGFSLHTENSAHILLPASATAFLNPVQEFNRDLSVAAIKVWAEDTIALKEQKWRKAQEKKGQKKGEPEAKRAKVDDSVPESEDKSTDASKGVPGAATSTSEYKAPKFTLLEALSATGLRSIRYAKEIPQLKYVIANDLSHEAVVAMQRNIDLNGLGPQPAPARDDGMSVDSESKRDANPRLGRVRVNEGDACSLMYNHRAEKARVDVVDLDPYGTAAPFVDPAVQCVSDGGLLCVTCTDLAVLATANFPEKCYANYGGIPVKTEYCHEVALRLVLHSLATAAARYGRYIEPLVSLSIDFYVRVFVRVRTAPMEVKKLASKSAVYYVCQTCQSFHEQPLGRVVEKVNEKSGNVNVLFKTQAGPPPSAGTRCDECGSTLHLAGPMWSAPIHNTAFVEKLLRHVEENEGKYGTAPRMKGMLTVAKEELHSPFYFTPAKIAGLFHAVTPSFDETASALLHAGYTFSRSHACPGSVKTNATRAQVFDIFRSWVKKNPVNMNKVSEGSPTRTLLAKESTVDANFDRHPQLSTLSSKIKLVRYQQNPLPNWGPGSRPEKRKRDEE